MTRRKAETAKKGETGADEEESENITDGERGETAAQAVQAEKQKNCEGGETGKTGDEDKQEAPPGPQSPSAVAAASELQDSAFVSPSKVGGAASSSGSIGAALKHGSAPERATALLKRLVLSAGVCGPNVENVSGIVCKVHLEQITHKMYDASTAEELESLQNKFNAGVSMTKELFGGLSKSASTLTAHVENKKRSAKRLRDQAVKDAELGVLN